MFAQMNKCAGFCFLLGSLSLPVWAEDNVCNQVLVQSQHETILNLTPASELPLSKSLVEQLRKHPIAKWAEYIETRSLSLDFAIEVPMLAMDDPHTKAENQQARQMAKYLNVLFPKSEIHFEKRSLSPETRNKKNIHLAIYDLGEVETKGDIAHRIYSVDNREELPVPLLKMGTPHPLSSLTSKIEFRRKLGFPTDAKRVASLYVPSVNSLDEHLYLLEALKASDAFDHIIVSFNQSELGFEESDHFQGMTRLSKVADEHAPGKVIWNDSLYRMPYIYTLSDFALVVGNINFLEPLNARVPTILYQTQVMKTEYNASVMNQMLSQAVYSGGFEKASTPVSFNKALQKMLTRPPKVLPPALLIKNGKTNFDRIFDRLLEMLKKQTGN